MNLIQNRLRKRTYLQDVHNQNNDRNSIAQRCSTSIHNSIDVCRQTHAMTFHLSNPREKSLSVESQESENEFLHTHRRATTNIINPHKNYKALQQVSYITQIMMPDYEKNINTISVIESKAYQIQLANQEDQRQQQSLNDGEIWIDYKFENHPIELKQDFVNVQKLRQLEFYYYKIRCQGEPVPLTFTMNQVEQTKFKVFLSTTNPFPSKFSCEQIFQVKTWKYKSKDYKQFRQKFIFISLVCDLDTTIKIQFTFGSPQGIQTQYKSPIAKQQIKQNLINCDLTASQIIKKRKKQMLQLSKGRNLIQENILNVTIQNDECFKSQKQLYKTLQQKKFYEVVKKRKQLEINTQGQKQINYFSKEITHLLKKLKQQKDIDQHRYLKSEIQLEMFRLIAYLQLINVIYEKLKHQHKIIHHVQIIQIKMKTIYYRAKKNMCKLKGNSLFARVHLDVKFCLSMLANQIKKKVRIQNINKIQPLLIQRSVLWNFKEKIHHTSRHLQCIKESIYNFILRYRVYKQFLRSIFEKNFDFNCQQYITNKDLKIQQQFELWHQNSKYLIYFQFLSKTFANIYGRQKLNAFFTNLRKQKKDKNNQRKESLLQVFSKKQDNQQIISLFKVPLQNDLQQMLPFLYEQTKGGASQYCRDQIRRPFNKLLF
ncbi:unnamed protein product [Paramecium primaurelia]|uniref:Uncharacterized protein n=1 Tax=Paramecium primaurelia TaxID=5886 RepID=A0A8S1LS97_PARPR|nr:unnamed protein product [Paramecium primaurelia]